MDSRTSILNNIKIRKPLDTRPLPVIELVEGGSYFAPFKESIKLVGGSITSFNEIDNIENWLLSKYDSGLNIYSEETLIPGNIDLGSIETITREDLEKIDITILNGILGVAENGAIWIDNLKHRVIPFIAEHLILVLNEESIVKTMHEAYDKLKIRTQSGFGCFISGPSKTADIEQSLVYGAHGPRTLTVILKHSNE